MKNTEQRLNNIIGQLEGVKKMLAAPERDCFKIITQLKAARSAIGALMEKHMESEVDSCLLKTKPAEKAQLKKIFLEITKK